ncbi:lipocalin-like domain-containing protein [Bacillus paramycoides]|uniref:lipocalin-like domain-containing protein n=1 Tax=Bacillus paramycoides TaxID=2026194 RepID=UPI002E1DB50D|nr:lipocalin-like domain-containing protein [Bacillus paramycoides]
MENTLIKARWGNDSEDYNKIGITHEIKPWEDGIRTTGDSGTYEWWYFDAHLEDGSTLVIVFMTKPYISPELPLTPQVNIVLDRPNGTKINRLISLPAEEFEASTNNTNVRIGKNSFVGNLKHFDIHVEAEDIIADIRLDNIVPAWRPGSGYMYFGDQDEHYFAWLPSTPKGKVSGTITINGTEENVSGIGYHDHNWGNISMGKVMHHWYWGRAEIGEYTVVSSYIYSEKQYGYHNFPIFMIAKGEQIIGDDPRYLKFTEKDEVIDEVTGKPYHKQTIYEYNNGSEHFVVTYTVEKAILQRKYIDEIPESQREAAKGVGFDSAYLRFTGEVVLERYEEGKIIETIKSPALWEEMYFGETVLNANYKQ